MFRNLFRGSLMLLCAATACVAQVQLSNVALPPDGTAGSSIESLIGRDFPAGKISTAEVSVSIAATCNGSPVVSVTPLFLSDPLFTFRDISFALPSALPVGTYALSIQGTTALGNAFTTKTCASLKVGQQDKFVRVEHGQLTLGGRPFRFSGGNEAGLLSTDPPDTDQLLQVAQANQLQALRIWTFIDIGNEDGSNSVSGPENGYYFQYWNNGAPAFNDGVNGLQNLDYSISQAGKKGFKLILTLTNNWTPGGGMDQYVSWAGDQYHDQFYTDPKIRAWYEGWVSHLLNHVNTYTGVAYKDDPAIMVWELANEPRCYGTGNYPTSAACTTTTLTNWVRNESDFIKSIDTKHLVAVGDEGPFCGYGSLPDANDGCSQGDDAVAFAQSPSIDLVGLHLYTQTEGTDAQYGNEYIDQHIQLGQTLGKPAYMGEYGLEVGDQRAAIYHSWQETILHGGGAGALVWSIAGGEPGPIAAEAETNLGLADQAPLLGTIRNFAQEAAVGSDLSFPPLADDQWATTTLNTPVPLNPWQNMVPYGQAAINSASLDLDPSTPGKQTSVHVYGGLFAASGSTVEFTPDHNFNGQAVAPFTVKDSKGNLSNTAYLFATVKPTQSVAYEIESFETGADGWSGTGDTATQSTLYATDGPHSLKVVATQTGWFGIQFAAPIDLSNRPSVAIDMIATGQSSSSDIAIQTGDNWLWCQSNAWPWLSAGTETTQSLPLTAAGAGCGGGTPDFSEVRAFYVYMVAGTTYYIDNVRAGAVPDNLLPIPISSFETGTQGWQSQNDNGTVAQTTAFYTDGQYGLQVTSTGGGGWFGTTSLGALNLSSKSGFAYDIDTPNNGTSVNIEIDSGSPTTRCTGTNWGWADSSNSTQVIPFSSLSCTPDLTNVTGVWIYFSPGTYYIDNVRAQ